MLSTYHVPDYILVTGDIAVNKRGQSAPHAAQILVEKSNACAHLLHARSFSKWPYIPAHQLIQ